MTASIRPYQPSDFDALYGVWQAALDSTWPITPEFLQRIVSGYASYREGDHLVAEQEGRVVGFIPTRLDSAGKTAEIPFVVVHPEKQRQGIGTQLHTAAIEHWRQKGVETVSLGHGDGYFWRGVPDEFPGVLKFFQSCGWHFNETDYDLTQDLHAYRTPPGVFERVTQQNIEIRLSSADEIAAILQFERRVFPDWAEIFQANADAGRYPDILVAWQGKSVVGSLLMEATLFVWHKMLGDDMGIIGVVGVDDQLRRRGIGVALTARASEILQARGVGQCFIGWTDEVEFYGKLGYKIWHSYSIADPRSISLSDQPA